MNTLAKLIIALWLPLVGACTQAQTYNVPTSAYGSEAFSRAELDQMLAPIALYPDTVLSHVLIASTYPLEVVRADRWARSNSHLDAEAAVAAVEHKNWDPSVRALVAFPQILQRLSEDLDWTQRLGDAFLMDEAQVMSAIQDLRQRAYASGSLNNMKHVNVQREKQIIIIEPAVERVVYIPYYDTRVVYGDWRWRDYPPTYWHHPANYVHIGGFYWGPRAYLSTGFFSTSFHWHQRRVVYIDRRRHHAPHVYSSRRIAAHDGAHHWQHNPSHRRGVAYRNERLREQFGGPRARFSQQQPRRESLRSASENIRRQQKNEGTVSVGQPRERLSTETRAETLRQRLSNDTGAQPPKRFGDNTSTQRRESLRSATERKSDESARAVQRAVRENGQTDVRERLQKSHPPVVERSREEFLRNNERSVTRENRSRDTPKATPKPRFETQPGEVQPIQRQPAAVQHTRPERPARRETAAPSRSPAREAAPARRESLRQAHERSTAAPSERAHRLQR